MTVTTAKVAGCQNIVACSPPRSGVGIHPAIVYTAHICGADHIVALGGVQGIAAMAFGLFGLPKADILVGPEISLLLKRNVFYSVVLESICLQVQRIR